MADRLEDWQAFKGPGWLPRSFARRRMEPDAILFESKCGTAESAKTA
jgi:hypothetical protein